MMRGVLNYSKRVRDLSESQSLKQSTEQTLEESLLPQLDTLIPQPLIARW